MNDLDALLDDLADRVADRVTERLAAVERPPERVMFTIDQAAEALGISAKGVRRMIGAGTIHSTVLQGRRLIHTDEIHRVARGAA